MKRLAGGKKAASCLLIILGLLLVLIALALEASRYPWGMLFGGTEQGEASLPAPRPIVLADEDRDSDIVEGEPTPGVPDGETDGPLPGDERAETAPVPVYLRLGVLKIPKLKVSQHILEGTGRQLNYGVGHVEGSGAIGQEGNCAVAGHNTSSFRYLHKIETGDSVILKTDDAVYTYSVYDSFTVLPEETWVLRPPEDETHTLTLITCTPYIVSSHRLIVRARLADINGMAPEEYYADQPA